MDTLIDIHSGILKYDKKEITLIVNDKGDPWFLARNVAEILIM